MANSEIRCRLCGSSHPFAVTGGADTKLLHGRDAGDKRLVAGDTLRAMAVLAAAAELAEPTASRAEVVSQARQFFTDRTGFVPVGLEELPSCWLQQLPTLLWNGHKPGE